LNEFIRESLGWTAGPWPPDFYGLLGLNSHTINADEVEAAVLFRMEKLRTYQLIQPDSVTEAMNLLARALITLSDPVAKAEYDRALVKGVEADGADQESRVRGQESTESGQGFQVHDVGLQPGKAKSTESFDSPSLLSERLTEGESLPPIPLEPTFSPTAKGPPPLPIRAATEIERSITGNWLHAQEKRPPNRSARFRRRNGPGRDRIRWIVQLRQLLRVWDEAGDWLAIPDLTFATRVEAVHLILALRAIARNGPTAIASRGPGSAIVALSDSRPTSTALMEITTARRQFLAKDWRAGRARIFEAYWNARQPSLQRRRTRSLQKSWMRHAWTVTLTLLGSTTMIIVVWRALRG
jgi:hypothetical protein